VVGVALDVIGRWPVKLLERGKYELAIFLLHLELLTPPLETEKSKTFNQSETWKRFATNPDWLCENIGEQLVRVNICWL
jgi:hypothetical protein